jgi:hypothetical protein
MRTNARPRGSPRIRLISSVAMLALVIGGVSVYSIRKTSELLEIGLNDHVRCAIAAAFPRQTGLGDRFAPMLQPILDAAGRDYAAVSVHRCDGDGRAYFHIILRRGQTPVSLILTLRGGAGEVFPRAVFPRALFGPLHEGKRDGYSVAGFESGAYLGYIVSALPGSQNSELAARVAPVIDRYTKR